MTIDQTTLDSLPQTSGIYMMKDKQGQVLYIGKGKVLQARIKQYFSKHRDQRAMVPYLVAQVASIDTMITFSDREALLLENTLIKKYRPKYNVLLKDDKTHISLVLTTKDHWPMLKLVRYRPSSHKEGKYFGPYTSAITARELLHILSTMFPLRECSDREFASRKRPCVLYDIQRCLAPCVGKCTVQEYQKHVQDCLHVLQGKNPDVIANLYREMEVAADALEFERAERLLRTIRNIETMTKEHRSTVYHSKGSYDALGMIQKGRFTFLMILVFRNGQWSDSVTSDFSCLAAEPSETIESFLLQYYDTDCDWPDEILLPIHFERKETVQEILRERSGRPLFISTPVRGEKKTCIDLAMKNARSHCEQVRLQSTTQEDLLLSLQETLGLTQLPARIDCFDTSNISGTDAVASMVVFMDGRKQPHLSRLYKIKTAKKSDDYGAMQEVLSRRYTKAKQDNSLPNLIIVDGGKGQLNIALEVLDVLDIATIDVIALVKEEGRHDKGLTHEGVYVRGEKKPIVLHPHNELLFFLQTIRDEAHRRAIAFHRKRRTHRLIKSILDDIPGIGPTKKKYLLQTFGSVEKVAQASDEELLAVKGISSNDVRSLRAHLL